MNAGCGGRREWSRAHIRRESGSQAYALFTGTDYLSCDALRVIFQCRRNDQATKHNSLQSSITVNLHDNSVGLLKMDSSFTQLHPAPCCVHGKLAPIHGRLSDCRRQVKHQRAKELLYLIRAAFWRRLPACLPLLLLRFTPRPGAICSDAPFMFTLKLLTTSWPIDPSNGDGHAEFVIDH